MAIDTRNKRASAIFPLLPFRAQLPAPDGTIGQGDKQAIVFLYSGILAAAEAAGALVCNFDVTVSDILTFEVEVSDLILFGVTVRC